MIKPSAQAFSSQSAAKAAGNLKMLAVADFEKLAGSGRARIVDCRSFDEFKQKYIPGSIPCPLEANFSFWLTKLAASSDDLLVVCHDKDCNKAQQLLEGAGFKNILGCLEGGIDSWQHLSKISEVAPAELKTKQAGGQALKLLDVRQPEEYEKDGIVKDAVKIPLGLVKEQAEKAIADKQAPVYVFCKAGVRGLVATSLMTSLGYKHAVNVQGGLMKLKEVGYN